MLIQTTKIRNDGTQIELYGKKYHFKPNDAGHHVAEVEDPQAIHRLVVEIPEAYKLYGDEKLPPLPKKEKSDQAIDLGSHEPHVPGTMLITDGEQEIDLMTLELEELRMLAKDTFEIQVHHKWNEQTIRNKIVEKTRAP